jgi:L-malate glycosyltransferase
LNILLIGHEDKLNGASRCLLDIADYMISKEDKVYVLTSYKSGDFYNELLKRDLKIIFYKHSRWKVVKPNSSLKWILLRGKYILSYLLELLTINSLILELKKYDIDAIHSNTSVTWIGGIIKRKLKVYHIWHLREFGEEDFNMYPILGEKITSKLMNKYSDIFIAISDAIKNKYSNTLDEDKIIKIYDGVKNYKNNKDRKGSINKLLIAGRVSRTKGQIEAVEMLNFLIKEKGLTEMNLYIAGVGDFQMIENLEFYNDIKSNIHFLGFRKDMNNVRENVDIELVCSKSEGFGLVTVEAMMFGHPVIGANTGATTELISDGVNGFLYEKGNIKDFAEKVTILLDRNKYEKISTNAYEYAKNNFLFENNVKKLRELYKSEMLNNKEQK